MTDRLRQVVGEYSTWYVCDVHDWDFTNADGDVCPVCLGETTVKERAIALLDLEMNCDCEEAMKHLRQRMTGLLEPVTDVALVKGATEPEVHCGECSEWGCYGCSTEDCDCDNCAATSPLAGGEQVSRYELDSARKAGVVAGRQQENNRIIKLLKGFSTELDSSKDSLLILQIWGLIALINGEN